MITVQRAGSWADRIAQDPKPCIGTGPTTALVCRDCTIIDICAALHSEPTPVSSQTPARPIFLEADPSAFIPSRVWHDPDPGIPVEEPDSSPLSHLRTPVTGGILGSVLSPPASSVVSKSPKSPVLPVGDPKSLYVHRDRKPSPYFDKIKGWTFVPDKYLSYSAERIIQKGYYNRSIKETVPWPDNFCLELDPEIPIKRENKHPIDFNRKETSTHPLPNLDLLGATGNPYKSGLAASVFVSMLQAESHLVEEITKLAGIDRDNTYQMIYLKGTLLDLKLFGLAISGKYNDLPAFIPSAISEKYGRLVDKSKSS